MRKQIKTIKNKQSIKKRVILKKSNSIKARKEKRKTLFALITGIFVVTSIIVLILFLKPAPKEINDEQAKWAQIYNHAIDFIKQHEGYRGKTYLCPAGYPTIGYGHQIKNTDRLPAFISEKMADSLLRADFDLALSHISDNMPYLKGGKKIAMAHFVFSLGVGTFSRSNLKQLIKLKKPIDNTILGYCYFRKDSQLVKSSTAMKLRRWELAQFNKTE